MKLIMENWKKFLNEQEQQAAPSKQDRLRATAAIFANQIKGKQGTQVPITSVRTGEETKIVSERGSTNYKIEMIGLLLQSAGNEISGATLGDFVKDQRLGAFIKKALEYAKTLTPEQVAKNAPIGAKLSYKQDALVDNVMSRVNDNTTERSVQTYVEYIVGLGDVQEGQFAGLKDKATNQQKNAVAKLGGGKSQEPQEPQQQLT